jgi:Leucine-rich repeat (LRR) protein
MCKNDYHSKHHFIQVDMKKELCLKHKKKFEYFCYDCQENFCDEEIEKEHKYHEIVKINLKDEQYKKYSNFIKKTNEEIKRIIGFNQLVLDTGEKFKNNYFHLKSIINLGKSYNEENKRYSKDIKCFLNYLSIDIENSNIAIEHLKNKKSIQIYRNEKYINLHKKGLNEQDFKYISQIKFNQLKEIDISENQITNIQSFNRMSLPFLELLNLSHNEIQIIEPVSNLKSKNIQYIYLQNNKIEDMETFLKSYFPSLKILRVEGNNIREEILKLINKKYSDKIIYKSFEEQIKEFNKRYKFDISGDNEIIDLNGKKGGDEMLNYLFLIITYKTENKINKLILSNNGIKDPSILNRINFNKLETLDLSFNEITNLKFVSDMKTKDLKYLYLNNNPFNSVFPLFKVNFQNLKVVSLNDRIQHEKLEELKKYKICRGIEIDESNTFKRVPKDEFLCPECKEFVPEIIGIHADNKTIEFQCKKCGIFEFSSIFYLSELAKNNYLYTKCNICHEISKDNNDIFSYCYDCKMDYCRNCEINHQKKRHTKIIKVNEKNNKCLEHYDEEINKFCLDCGESICNKSNSNLHKEHKLIKLEDLKEEFLKYKNII